MHIDCNGLLPSLTRITLSLPFPRGRGAAISLSGSAGLRFGDCGPVPGFPGLLLISSKHSFVPPVCGPPKQAHHQPEHTSEPNAGPDPPDCCGQTGVTQHGLQKLAVTQRARFFCLSIALIMARPGGFIKEQPGEPCQGIPNRFREPPRAKAVGA